MPIVEIDNPRTRPIKIFFRSDALNALSVTKNEVSASSATNVAVAAHYVNQ